MSVDADVVMMSKASDEALASMTQVAINSAHKGASRRRINVIVMEQCQVEYAHATTIYAPGKFNYNAFANHAARQGSAPNIVVANNDLRFQSHWLDRLIRADWPVVSPLNAGYHRHRNVMSNETGQQVGRHLAGWCFMIRRELWEEIGGFDESYPFWCADNAVMRQLVAIGIRPMVVRDAHVDHDVSVTLFRETPEVQAELTWGAVHRFNQEYGEHIGKQDLRYEHWQRNNNCVGSLKPDE